MKKRRQYPSIGTGVALALLISSCAGIPQPEPTTENQTASSTPRASKPSKSETSKSDSERKIQDVPDVRSNDLDKALETLGSKGFKTQVKGAEIQNFEVPKDPQNWRVIAQNPEPGESLEKNSLVQLAVQKKDDN